MLKTRWSYFNDDPWIFICWYIAMLLIEYSTMSVVLCNGDDVKIVQNGFIMRDHCIQLMLRPHSLLLQSHRDQRSLTLPCCQSCLLPFFVHFLQLHQPGFKYCCGLSCLLDWCPTCYMSLSFGWTSLDHYIRTWPICSHTVTHHQFGAWAEDPFICNHGNVDTTQFIGQFFSSFFVSVAPYTYVPPD